VNVADHVVAFLGNMGVTHVFGYPGSPLVPLLAALERQSTVRWVLMRHENSAALAASAQARLTGRTSVCIATSGPGALNFVCGVIDAQMDRVPMLALTGLVSTASLGHWEFQDIDQTRLFGALLHHSAECVHPDQLMALLRNYAGHAQQRQETVHLGLPANILSAEVDTHASAFHLDPQRLPAPLQLMPPPEAALDIVADEIAQYEQPVIVLGRRALGCGAAIEGLAERLGAPIITSLDGKGIVDESHPNALGVLGIFGFPAVEATTHMLQRADLILAFGVDTLKPFLTDTMDIQRRRLIQCELDPSMLTPEYHRVHALLGPLDAIASGLRDRVQPRADRPAITALVHEREDFLQSMQLNKQPDPDDGLIHPVTFLMQLNGHLDERTIITLDTGAHTIWAAQFLQLTKRQRVLVSSRLGTMGFSLPAAIAAQLARPDHKVIAICGDGGFQMVVGELATAVQERLPIVIIVFNNGVLQNVAVQQRAQYGTAITNPDFVALARAYGGDGAVVDGRTDVDAVMRQAFAPRATPFLIDMRCSPDVMVPVSKWEHLRELLTAASA
jgi:thiamine pyrophosphate-dependent acetolactate synthase large subunit-like protein